MTQYPQQMPQNPQYIQQNPQMQYYQTPQQNPVQFQQQQNVQQFQQQNFQQNYQRQQMYQQQTIIQQQQQDQSVFFQTEQLKHKQLYYNRKYLNYPAFGLLVALLTEGYYHGYSYFTVTLNYMNSDFDSFEDIFSQQNMLSWIYTLLYILSQTILFSCIPDLINPDKKKVTKNSLKRSLTDYEKLHIQKSYGIGFSIVNIILILTYTLTIMFAADQGIIATVIFLLCRALIMIFNKQLIFNFMTNIRNKYAYIPGIGGFCLGFVIGTAMYLVQSKGGFTAPQYLDITDPDSDRMFPLIIVQAIFPILFQIGQIIISSLSILYPKQQLDIIQTPKQYNKSIHRQIEIVAGVLMVFGLVNSSILDMANPSYTTQYAALPYPVQYQGQYGQYIDPRVFNINSIPVNAIIIYLIFGIAYVVGYIFLSPELMLLISSFLAVIGNGITASNLGSLIKLINNSFIYSQTSLIQQSLIYISSTCAYIKGISQIFGIIPCFYIMNNYYIHQDKKKLKTIFQVFYAILSAIQYLFIIQAQYGVTSQFSCLKGWYAMSIISTLVTVGCFIVLITLTWGIYLDLPKKSPHNFPKYQMKIMLSEEIMNQENSQRNVDLTTVMDQQNKFYQKFIDGADQTLKILGYIAMTISIIPLILFLLYHKNKGQKNGTQIVSAQNDMVVQVAQEQNQSVLYSSQQQTQQSQSQVDVVQNKI